MADSKTVMILDVKLIEMKILDPQYKKDYIKVHKKLNSLIKKTGAILSDEVFKLGENQLFVESRQALIDALDSRNVAKRGNLDL